MVESLASRFSRAVHVKLPTYGGGEGVVPAGTATQPQQPSTRIRSRPSSRWREGFLVTETGWPVADAHPLEPEQGTSEAGREDLFRPLQERTSNHKPAWWYYAAEPPDMRPPTAEAAASQPPSTPPRAANSAPAGRPTRDVRAPAAEAQPALSYAGELGRAPLRGYAVPFPGPATSEFEPYPPAPPPLAAPPSHYYPLAPPSAHETAAQQYAAWQRHVVQHEGYAPDARHPLVLTRSDVGAPPARRPPAASAAAGPAPPHGGPPQALTRPARGSGAEGYYGDYPKQMEPYAFTPAYDGSEASWQHEAPRPPPNPPAPPASRGAQTQTRPQPRNAPRNAQAARPPQRAPPPARPYTAPAPPPPPRPRMVDAEANVSLDAAGGGLASGGYGRTHFEQSPAREPARAPSPPRAALSPPPRVSVADRLTTASARRIWETARAATKVAKTGRPASARAPKPTWMGAGGPRAPPRPNAYLTSREHAALRLADEPAARAPRSARNAPIDDGAAAAAATAAAQREARLRAAERQAAGAALPAGWAGLTRVAAAETSAASRPWPAASRQRAFNQMQTHAVVGLSVGRADDDDAGARSPARRATGGAAGLVYDYDAQQPGPVQIADTLLAGPLAALYGGDGDGDGYGGRGHGDANGYQFESRLARADEAAVREAASSEAAARAGAQHRDAAAALAWLDSREAARRLSGSPARPAAVGGWDDAGRRPAPTRREAAAVAAAAAETLYDEEDRRADAAAEAARTASSKWVGDYTDMLFKGKRGGRRAGELAEPGHDAPPDSPGAARARALDAVAADRGADGGWDFDEITAR